MPCENDLRRLRLADSTPTKTTRISQCAVLRASNKTSLPVSSIRIRSIAWDCSLRRRRLRWQSKHRSKEYSRLKRTEIWHGVIGMREGLLLTSTTSPYGRSKWVEHQALFSASYVQRYRRAFIKTLMMTVSRFMIVHAGHT